MPSAFHRTLPARADLEQQKKLAKELLVAFEKGDDEARARVRAELPDKNPIVLADAQFVLSREYGFAKWSDLKQHLEALNETTRSPIERFKRAVEQRDAKALRRVLEQHQALRAKINDPMFGFDSPAITAATDDFEVIDTLLEFGADPNRKSSWWAGGFHALYSATGAVADRLIAGGATVDACAAAHLDRLDVLAQLIADDPSRVNERGGDGQTPLHFARSREAIDMLLDAGADIDARDVDHRSSAAEWMIGDEARLPLAKYLVERGAPADPFLVAALGLTDRVPAMDPALLSLRTGQGAYAEWGRSSYHIYLWTIAPNVTPLQTAAKFKQFETLAAMKRLATPVQRLLLACDLGDGDDARAIVRDHPGIVEGLTGADRRSLTDEAWRGNAPAVELMMELGFDPTAPAVTGPTGGNALHCAAWQGSVGSVAAIVQYPSGKALIDSREPVYNGTPLSWCCHGSRNCGDPNADHAGVARVLIAAGAKVDPGLNACSEEMQAVLDAAIRASRS